MPIAPGSRLGPYEIVGPIGKGGMGEVYRARDTSPFAGEDVSDTLAAVIRAEPDLDALPSDTPESARLVVRLCLQKDVTKRFQSVGDVRLALEGAFEPERTASIEPVAALRLWQRPLPATFGAIVAPTALRGHRRG